MKIMLRPTIVHVVVHASGTTDVSGAGGLAIAIRTAMIPVTIAGRIKRETNFNAIGSAIVCLRLTGKLIPRVWNEV